MKPRPITNRHEARASFAPYSISRWYNSSAKRAFDLVGAICLFVVCFPVMVLVAVGVKLTSPGPVIFRQRRPGRQGREFNILKFRTMVDERRNPGPVLTRAKDPRVTWFGRHMRKWKLDELPQLWNVLMGDMSFVGPRPQPTRLWKEPSIQTEAAGILSVRPGITSQATVNFRNEEELLAPLSSDEVEKVYLRSIMPVKLKIDLAYLRDATLFTDMVIVFRTVFRIFRRHPEQDVLIGAYLPEAEPRRARDAAVAEFRPVVEKEDYSGVAEQTD